MWIAVAKTSEILPETARVVRAGALDLALVSTRGDLLALDNTCPHTGGSLGEGLVQDNRLTCPLHAWQFDCKTGACLTEKRPPLRRYETKVEGGQIWVQIPDAAVVPAPDTAAGSNGWIPAVPLTELIPGAVRKVRVVNSEVALISSAEGVLAFENSCPHQGGPLSEGSVEGTTVTCPLHGFKFEGKTGACLTEARYSLRRFETKVDQGKVWVRISPASAPASEEPAPSKEKSPAEIWKSAKHGIDVWPDLLRYAQDATPMSKIPEADLERMKWYGYFYRKNNDNDHYMCRVRIPGCEMTSRQAKALAFVAYESGYSILDVTTRGNIQVQGLTIDKLPGIRAALERVGLSSRQSGHDNVRNVTSHPYSGIDPEELMDTRELSRGIQEMIVGDREFSDLPRKFNIAISGRQDPSTHAWTQDISYVATWGTAGRVAFQILVGGNQGQSPNLAWHLPVLVLPEQVMDVTAAILRVFRELGYRHNRHQVRFRYLIERLGVDQILIEVQKRLGFRLDSSSRSAPKQPRHENFLGWFKQKQHDLWAVGICVPVGRLTWDQFEGLAIIAQQYGWGALRTTHDQNLIIPGIPSSLRQTVSYAIARYGLTFEPDPVTRNMVACTGKQFCNIAVTETKGYAYQLIETLRRRNVQLHGIKIHMSGCPSACALSYTADIGLKGVKVRRGLRVLDAFDVYLGGGLGGEVQLGSLYQKLVPMDQLPDLIEKIVHEFYLRRSDTQTFSEYWRSKLEGHKADVTKDEIPKWRCSRCGQIHVAADPPPFCPVCSALRAKFEPAPEEVQTASPGEVAASSPAQRPVPDAPPLWLCKSCGLKHSGEEAPELCPVCGVKKTEFQKPGGLTAVAGIKAKPAGKRLLIVGGSIAGYTAAQALRSFDTAAQITLVTDEPYPFYNRLNLTRLLAGEVERKDLFDYQANWCEENQVAVLTNTRAIGVDPIKKNILLAEGRELAYDSCILTHGSSANVPSFYRSGLAGLYLLRTLDDVEGIMAQTRSGTKVAVIGGGVLGLEAAYGLVKRGADVKVFEYMPRLMPRQLDPSSAELFGEMVRAKGIEPFVGVGVKELAGRDRVEGLVLADGRSFRADLVVVSTGIKPNIDWVKRSGIDCNLGITVDDRMKTSADDVFAAGDVAEWRGQVVGLWTNAIEQAKVAAASAAGKIAFYRGFLPVTILKCLGIPLVSMGEILEDTGGITSKTRHDLKGGVYRRVILRDGIPIGGILLGTTEGMGEMRKLIENGLELEQLRRKVVPDDLALASA
jgi:ferredoxin-nitrite reductase